MALRMAPDEEDEDDDDDDDDDCGVWAGLARPSMNATKTSVDEEKDDEVEDSVSSSAEGGREVQDEMEETGAAGLPGADEAFDLDSAPVGLELDPFRVAGPQQQPTVEQPATNGKASKGTAVKASKKVFVGGLSRDTTDFALTKFFVRFGKVQEAAVVCDGAGKPRGFGFVTFVHQKGATYCLDQAGDAGEFSIDGRSCRVSYAADKGSGVPHYKMPARGQYDPKPAKARGMERAPGGVAVGGGETGGQKRAPARDDDDDAEGSEAPRRKARKKEEIVNVTRREDAEPLYDRAITMRELFPKEFWRV